jgi:hypothetical protein
MDLVYAASETAFALCGLGPIVPGYTVVATKLHTSSGADIAIDNPSFVAFAESVRSFLSLQYGPTLLTEHGRMPACTGPAGKADPHCFHAHFLLFPGAPFVNGIARSYFATEHSWKSVQEALSNASTKREYMLLSPTADSASIFLRPGRLIPQFARRLVAEATGRADLTNWRNHPARREAVEAAYMLRVKAAGANL